jgi:putative ABC transport system substrate-binding protein
LPRARQSATPVIGYLSGGSPGPLAPFAAAFREALKDAGYVEDRNVAIEYRSAEEVFLTARVA